MMINKKFLAVSIAALMAVSAGTCFADADSSSVQEGLEANGNTTSFSRGHNLSAMPRSDYEKRLDTFVAEKKIDETDKQALLKRFDAAKEFYAANSQASDALAKIKTLRQDRSSLYPTTADNDNS